MAKSQVIDLTVSVELDPEKWANEYGIDVSDAKADAGELIAALLLTGLRNHAYLLDKAAAGVAGTHHYHKLMTHKGQAVVENF